MVEIVPSFKYLGGHIANNMKWEVNSVSLKKKAHQRVYSVRRLKQAGLGTPVLTSFHRCAVESILTSCITVWYGNCSAADRKALQRVVKTPEKICGSSLPPVSDIYASRCRSKATSIMKDATHPAHSLFFPLRSGRRLQSRKARTKRMLNSFYPKFANYER